MVVRIKILINLNLDYINLRDSRLVEQTCKSGIYKPEILDVVHIILYCNYLAEGICYWPEGGASSYLQEILYYMAGTSSHCS